MGQYREHPGHGADARRRIVEAREHYEQRKTCRPKQRWLSAQTGEAAQKKEEGAFSYKAD